MAVIGAIVTAAVVAAVLWWRRRWRVQVASDNSLQPKAPPNS